MLPTGQQRRDIVLDIGNHMHASPLDDRPATSPRAVAATTLTRSAALPAWSCLPDYHAVYHKHWLVNRLGDVRSTRIEYQLGDAFRTFTRQELPVILSRLSIVLRQSCPSVYYRNAPHFSIACRFPTYNYQSVLQSTLASALCSAASPRHTILLKKLNDSFRMPRDVSTTLKTFRTTGDQRQR
ncbi:hypothetical protein NEOLEDRAFT_192856 [Neolentinus lepideus HHB14362 ss-1]|uniref:Uncharacterized protein n=1 Tax=Neolentinus lepideus HHB14362 ss-1 TaxID=1314782 RepID=A0A165MFN4_9AGAM|nr:hypothetical protein NEOLEDRAFT_192856 [Neolentinus lepideus HHB14362 ss-1]